MALPLLLVAATSLETKPFRDVTAVLEARALAAGELLVARDASFALAHLGIGKVNTALGLALAIRELEPARVVQVGIGGAFVGSFLSNGMLAVATGEVHMDSGVRLPDRQAGMEELGFPLLERSGERHYNAFPTDAELTERVAAAAGATPCPFGTSEAVTGSLDEAARLAERWGVAVESMEGAAAAHVCLALGVPFAEVRAISNTVGERDKRAWDLGGAVRALNEALPRVVGALTEA